MNKKAVVELAEQLLKAGHRDEAKKVLALAKEANWDQAVDSIVQSMTGSNFEKACENAGVKLSKEEFDLVCKELEGFVSRVVGGIKNTRSAAAGDPMADKLIAEIDELLSDPKSGLTADRKKQLQGIKADIKKGGFGRKGLQGFKDLVKHLKQNPGA